MGFEQRENYQVFGKPSVKSIVMHAINRCSVFKFDKSSSFHLDVCLREEPRLSAGVGPLPPSLAHVLPDDGQHLAAPDRQLTGARLAIEVVQGVRLKL